MRCSSRICACGESGTALKVTRPRILVRGTLTRIAGYAVCLTTRILGASRCSRSILSQCGVQFVGSPAAAPPSQPPAFAAAGEFVATRLARVITVRQVLVQFIGSPPAGGVLSRAHLGGGRNGGSSLGHGRAGASGGAITCKGPALLCFASAWPNPSFKPSPNSAARRPASAGPAAHFALAVQHAALPGPA